MRLGAVDAAGHPVDARVLVDGTPLAAHTNGDPVPVDPGEHLFHFIGPGGSTADVRQTFEDGERARPIAAVLAVATVASPEALSTEKARRSIPVGSVILGGVGVAGLALGAALTIKGHVDAGDLRSSCAPACTPSSVDSISHQYNIAWAGAGVGVAAFGAAVLLWRPWEHVPSPASPPMSAWSTLQLIPLVTPTFAGAGLTLMF